MKKVLSFVLVLAMILGCTAMAFAAPATTAAKSAVPFPDAADNGIATILKDLGVLVGDEKGNANLDKTISRAEFCTILLRALGRESVAKASADPKPFTDFKKADWFSGYVMAAYNEKIADGVSKTAFDPLGTVTADQAVTFVVKALGYDAAHVTGTWPLNYRIIASDLGLIPADFDFDNAEITRGEVFEVLFAALDKALVAWDAKAEEFKPASVAYGAQSTMTKRLGGTSIGAMYLTVDELTLKADTAFANKFDASEFVGKRVELLKKDGAYYGIYSVVSETLEGSFNKDASATPTSFAGLACVGTPDIYVNGVMTTAGLALAAAPSLTSKVAVTAEVEKSEDGKTVTLYSIAYDLKAETVVLTTAQAATLAKGTTTNAIKTYSFEVSGKAIKEGSYVLEGVDALADLEGGEVVDVYLKSGDGKIAKLVVTDNQIVGKVTKIQTKKSVKYITVDGTAYKLAAGVEATPNYTSEYALSLNADGEIAKIELYNPAEATVTKEWNYAFVLDVATTAAKTTASKWEAGAATTETTGYAICFIDFADTEAQTVEVASKAACVDANGDWTITSGDAIKYTVDEDGNVTEITKAATDFTDNGAVVTPTALGIGNVRYAADVKVVVYDAAKGATNAAAYTVKTVADLTGKGFDPHTIGYTLDSTKKINQVFAEVAGSAGSTVTYITGAAVTASWNEDKATYATILFDGEEVDYDTTPLLDVTTVAGLEVLTLTSGKVTAQTALAANYVFTTTKGISCDEYNVYTTTGAVATTSPTGFVVGGYFGLDDEVLIYVFNDEEGYYEVSEDALEDVLKAAKAVTFYDLDKDGYMDTVVAK